MRLCAGLPAMCLRQEQQQWEGKQAQGDAELERQPNTSGHQPRAEWHPYQGRRNHDGAEQIEDACPVPTSSVAAPGQDRLP